MAEDLLVGEELKKMVKVATKGPLAFAFNPGKGEDEPYFSMHRTKSPEVLGRTAKAEGAGPKVAFGTCMVADRVMSMTCLTELPGLAKRVKRFLKSQNVQLNVRILGADGTVLEEDIELLPEDLDAEGQQAVAAPAPDAAETAVPPDRSELANRARALGPRIAAAPAQIAERLAPALRQAVENIKADALAPAASLLDQIEAVLSRLLPPGEAAGTPPAAPPQPPAQDAAELVARIKAAQALLPGLPSAITGNISAALTSVVGVLKSGDIANAGEMLTKIESALRSVAERGAETAAPPPPDPRTEKLQAAADELGRRIAKLGAGDASAALLQRMASIDEAIAGAEIEAAVAQLKQVQESLRLLAEVERLTPLVTQAMSSGAVADANALRITFDSAIELSTGDDPGRAAALLQRVEAMLSAGAKAGLTRLDDVPDDVQPFAKARLKWGQARKTLFGEMSRLKTAIRAACDGKEDLQEIADSVDELDDYVEAMDARLEDKLDQIVGSEAGVRRQALKAEARAIIAEHLKELDAPFFQDVDAGNGFEPVAVASTARAALSEISRVLAD